MPGWQNNKFNILQFDTLASWQKGNMTKWKFDKMAGWWKGNWTKWLFAKMTQNHELTKWQVNKLQVVKMASCWRAYMFVTRVQRYKTYSIAINATMSTISVKILKKYAESGVNYVEKSSTTLTTGWVWLKVTNDLAYYEMDSITRFIYIIWKRILLA